MTCEICREQILPYLYDLLEPIERQQLSAHLENCATCQETLNAVREQVGMLAEAVKPEKAAIVFKAPVKATPASTAPTVNMPRTPRRFFLLNRWSLAASILLVLFSIGAVIGGTIWRGQSNSLENARQRLAKAREDLSKTTGELNHKRGQTQKEIRAIQQEIDQVFQQWKKEENTTRRTLEKERVQIIVNGPRVAQAGAPNRYDVELRQEGVTANFVPAPFGKGPLGKQNQQALPGAMPSLQARVINQKTQKILYEQQLRVQDNARANFDLPTDLPIMPGDDLALEFQTQTPEGKLVNLRDNLNLVFPEFVTHLTTDRPMYRPGETVRFRSLTLERFSLKPAQQDFHLRYRILGPRGEEIHNKEVVSQVVAGKDNEPIKGPNGQRLGGLGAGEHLLPADLPEGPYTLAVSEVNERFNEEKRSFQVRRWQTPRFNKEVSFHRSSYGPGDQVKFTVRVTPVQEQAPGARNIIQATAHVVVDGQPINVESRHEQSLKETRVDFTCNLPGQLFKGVGSVTIKCDNGAGDHDTTVRSLPIVLRDLLVEFYPEGGDLIAGVPNRVYFQARTPANKPADFEGVILDERSQVVARIQTLTDEREPGINQGLGSFTFTPQPMKPYKLRIDAPIGIDGQLPLPIVKNTGVVLHLPQGVVENEIHLTLHSAKSPRELLVGAYCRGRMLDHKLVKVAANKPTPVTLRPQAGVGGVYRITVFEKVRDGDAFFYRPLAERLIYRKGQAHVDVAVESDRPSYQPGDPVELRFKALNEKKEYVPAVALIAVVDSSVRRLVDDKTDRAMPTHFLLTTEIRNPEDLENADVLLGSHPKAAAALDLLLGCQGWRRFAEQDPKVFAQRQMFAQGNQQAKNAIFLANANAVPQFLDAEQKQVDKLDQAFVAKAIDLNKELAEKEKDEVGPGELRKTVEALQMEVQASQNQFDDDNHRLREMRGFLFQFGLGGAMLTLLFIGFFLISIGLRRLAEGGKARPWLFPGLALLGLLFLVSIIGTFTLMGEPLFEDHRFGDRRNMMFAKVGVEMKGPNAQDDVDRENAWPMLEDEFPAELPKAVPLADAKKRKLAVAAVAPNQAVFQAEEQKRDWVGNDAVLGQQVGFPVALDDRTLRREGNYQAILQRQLGRRVQLPPVHDPCVVREYAHQHKVQKGDVPRDFTETVYWHPVLVMPDGHAQVKFELSDSVTRYEVLVLSHTFDGRLGSNRVEIVAKLPFSVKSTVPIEVTDSDRIAIPVAVTNEMPKAVSAALSVRVKELELEGNAERALPLKANESRRELFHVKPSIKEGEAAFRVGGKTPGRGDAVERKFTVVPNGFPVTGSISGVIENATIEHAIDLPEQLIPGSLKVQAHFYPSPLAELQSGLEAMLREPLGCFEQSSSSNYSNVLILQYLKQPARNGPANPLAEKRARQLLQSGYQKLTAFECTDPHNRNVKRGYEWFGATAPPHEALTAYGLLQFRDMAKIHRVEDDMLQRTEQYLLDSRDGKGGFQRNPSGLDQVGRAPDGVTNAYIVWALTESGVKENLDTELTALREECKLSKDPYFLALVGLSHLNRKETVQGIEILLRVRALQDQDGHVAGAKTSITGSQGRDLAVETTALAVLGWLKAEWPDEFNANLQSAMKWLGQQRRGAGGYGGTQATILALKAMVAHAQKYPRNIQGGDVRLSHGPIQFQGAPDEKFGFRNDDINFGGRDGNRASFTARSQDVVTLTLRDPEALVPGKKNILHLNAANGNTLPYTLTWVYRTLKPANDPKAPIKLAAKLGVEQAKEGDTVKLSAVIENVSGTGQGMTVAVLGLPGGLTLPVDAQQLKALVLQDGPGKISAWELRGRELVLYWRDLGPKAKIEIELDLLCRLPGLYRGPASRAYLYYDADRKFWVEPMNLRIDEVK